MELVRCLSGLPVMLLMALLLLLVYAHSKGYAPTKWYKLVLIILFIFSLLDVFVVNADLYPL
mgnify:FL=1